MTQKTTLALLIDGKVIKKEVPVHGISFGHLESCVINSRQNCHLLFYEKEGSLWIKNNSPQGVIKINDQVLDESNESAFPSDSVLKINDEVIRLKYILIEKSVNHLKSVQDMSLEKERLQASLTQLHYKFDRTHHEIQQKIELLKEQYIQVEEEFKKKKIVLDAQIEEKERDVDELFSLEKEKSTEIQQKKDELFKLYQEYNETNATLESFKVEFEKVEAQVEKGKQSLSLLSLQSKEYSHKNEDLLKAHNKVKKRLDKSSSQYQAKLYDLNLIQKRVSQKSEELAFLEKKVHKLKASNQALSAESGQLFELKEQKALELNGLFDEIKRKKEELEKEGSSYREMTVSCKLAQDKLDKLNESNKTAQEEFERFHALNDQFKTQNKILEQKKFELSESLDQIHLDLEKKVHRQAELSTQYEALFKEINAKKQYFDRLCDEVAHIEGNKASLIQAVGELEQKSSFLTERLSLKVEEIQKANLELQEQVGRNHALKQESLQLETKLHRFEEVLKQSKEESTFLSESIHKLKIDQQNLCQGNIELTSQRDQLYHLIDQLEVKLSSKQDYEKTLKERIEKLHQSHKVKLSMYNSLLERYHKLDEDKSDIISQISEFKHERKVLNFQVANLQSEIEQLKIRAVSFEELISNFEKTKIEQRDELYQIKMKFYNELEEEKRAFLSKANDEADQKIEAARGKANDLIVAQENAIEQAKAQAKRIVEDSKAEANILKEAEVARVDKLENKLRDDLTAEKMVFVKNILHTLKNDLNHEVKALEILKKIESNPLDYFKQEIEAHRLSLLGSGFQTLPKHIQRFWIKVGSTLAAAMVLLLVGVFSPKFYSNLIGSIGSMLSKDESASRYLASVEKARERMFFRPEKTLNLKESFVDNILYTSNYLELVFHPDFQTEYVNRFTELFVDEYLISEERVFELMILEKNLNKDLAEMSEGLFIDEKEVGIKKMRELEVSVDEKIRSLLNSEKNYQSYKKEYRNFVLNFKNSKNL